MTRRSFFTKLFGGAAAGVGVVLWKPSLIVQENVNALPQYHSVRGPGFEIYQSYRIRKLIIQDMPRDLTMAATFRVYDL